MGNEKNLFFERRKEPLQDSWSNTSNDVLCFAFPCYTAGFTVGLRQCFIITEEISSETVGLPRFV